MILALRTTTLLTYCRVRHQAVEFDVAAEHERIRSSLQPQVLSTYALASPERLVGIGHHHVLNVDVVHLAKHFRRVDVRVGHPQMVAIPQCRASAHIEMATVNHEPVHMPERIVALKTAICRLDVAALLYRRLAFAYHHIVEV